MVQEEVTREEKIMFETIIIREKYSVLTIEKYLCCQPIVSLNSRRNDSRQFMCVCPLQDSPTKIIWKDKYIKGVRIILNGPDHLYVGSTMEFAAFFR